MASSNFNVNQFRKSPKLIDITGRVFGRLTAISYVGDSKWRCLCECGEETSVDSYKLKMGRTKSCGCFNREMIAIRSTTHGNTKRIGGQKNESPEYKAWVGMIQRCCNAKNPDYHNYGGRGIFVCDKWRHSFESFLVDMGVRPSLRHSIDRIDNNKEYSPENCRWANRKEQNNNRRSNRLIEFCGQSKNIGQWAKDLGIAQSVISQRLDRNHWCVNCALTIPPVVGTNQASTTCTHRGM